MKKFKKILFVVIIIVVWICLLLFVNKVETEKQKESDSQFVILNGNNFWMYHNKNWVDVQGNYDKINLINWQKFDVYIDNKYNNTYTYVFKDDRSYFFDDYSKSYDVFDDYILINKDSFLDIISFEEQQFNGDDYDIVEKFLYNVQLDNTDYKIAIKYFISDTESIYVVSNYNNAIPKKDIYFVIFYRKNNKSYLIAKGDSEFNYNLHAIISSNKKYNSFILKYGCYDGYCYDMYEYNKGKYIKVIGE